MSKRKIIKINENKCNGCGLCIPNCPEGAIQIIDQKARLISDLCCDGLGACLGHCPQGAITIEEREAEEYNEKKVMENIVKQGPNVIKAHLHHLKEHSQSAYLKDALDYLEEKGIRKSIEEDIEIHAHRECPGSRIIDLRPKQVPAGAEWAVKLESRLANWPVQLMLVPAYAPYLKGADILIAADCVPFAYANFHEGLLKGKVLLVGCPKLDDAGIYKDKLTRIFKENEIKSISYAHMEVPCCFGLVSIIQSAIDESGKKVPFKEIVIAISGERLK
ncbi:MAG: 4Fe-4S binding protein [Candidatus Omnitrophota bacterium]|nr:4Fe-4S binding protein [Candidatus Omnitrophota bacterium]